MKNNYKILNVNYEALKNIKFNNYSNNNYNNDNINFSVVKLIIVFICISIVYYKINYISNIIELENKEIYDEEQSNIQGTPIYQSKKDFWNITLLKNEMHYYSLYYQFKFPDISFILTNIDNNKKDFIETINQIKCLTSQNYSNIEIIFHIQKMEKYKYKTINDQLKRFIKDKTIKLYIKEENISQSYSSLINLSKGAYTIFIDKLSLLYNLSIHNLYELKKSSNDNLLILNISNNINIYLLKTKLLKDLIDNGQEFNSINEILTNMYNISLPKFNYIRVSLCPDNHFTNLAYVTMTSILSSKNFNSFICFYLIIPSNFEKYNENFLDSLHEQYDGFNITFITMDDRYNKAYTDRRITTQAYYRFSLGELIQNINKIIYFDTDIIVYKDLSNFYNLNFNGKMILGQASYGNKNAQKRGFHRINTGVLLLNLKAMRENKFEEQVIDVIKKGRKLSYHDQTLLNDYFKKYIGIFPPEYHTRPWSNYYEMKKFTSKIGKPFDLDYFYFANKYPVVRHFLGGYKPRNPNVNFIEDWWFFARKSKYYNDSSKNFESAFSY